MPLASTSDDDWKKREAEMKKKIQGLKGKGKIGTELAKEAKQQGDGEVQMKCSLAHRVFDEGLDMYREGDMTFPEFIDDLAKTLKAIE